MANFRHKVYFISLAGRQNTNEHCDINISKLIHIMMFLTYQHRLLSENEMNKLGNRTLKIYHSNYSLSKKLYDFSGGGGRRRYSTGLGQLSSNS